MSQFKEVKRENNVNIYQKHQLDDMMTEDVKK